MFWMSRFQVIGAVLTVGLLTAAPSPAQPSGYEGYQVVHIAIADKAELAALTELQKLGSDFEVWSEVVGLGIGPIEVRVAPAAQPALQASGLHYEVIIADLQRYLDGLYGDSRGDFFDSLRTYEQHAQFMDDLAAAYPELAERVSLGMSVQFRPMWALRITGPNARRKPAVLYHGAEHGNEQAPSSVVAYVAEHLLTNYGSDPEVTALVDNVEWYLMPIMNPDGYVIYSRYNANGVDLNRNWDGPGSGLDPSGGPYPFSEPETAALRDFLLDNSQVRVHVDIHGYVPYIMWPWAHTAEHCPDHASFLEIGTEMRERVAASGGGTYEIGTIYDLIWYPISGCSTNYSYGVAGLWALAIEVVDDDMPDICTEFLTSLLYVGEWIDEHDCNANGVFDADDIAAGSSFDSNGNGVPDECECPGELNGDGVIDLADLAMLLSNYGMPDGATYHDGDVTGDGAVDLSDLAALLSVYGTVCS
jgi:carboxypeptidase A2